jgi:glyoxylase I family protein
MPIDDTRSQRDDKPNARQIFHININCTNLDRSRVFYELIGFKVANDFGASSQGGPSRTFAEIGLARILSLPDDCDARALFMALSDDGHATRLDLIQWIRPHSAPHVRGDLARIGFGRLCLKVRDCQDLHDRLVAAGHAVYSPPIRIDMGGTHQLVFCGEDPDGTVIEYMQFLREPDQ